MIRTTIALAAAVAATAGAYAPAAQATTPASKVTVADLPRGTDIVFPGVTFTMRAAAKGEGQAPVSACQLKSWAQLGANATFAGDYRAVAGRGTGRAQVGTADATVASFKTHAAAVTAAKTMAAGFTGCTTRYLKTQPKGTTLRTSTRSVKLPGGQVATLFALNTSNRWGNTLEETAVVATGTHAEIVSIHLTGVQATFGTDEIRTTVTRAVRTLA